MPTLPLPFHNGCNPLARGSALGGVVDEDSGAQGSGIAGCGWCKLVRGRACICAKLLSVHDLCRIAVELCLQIGSLRVVCSRSPLVVAASKWAGCWLEREGLPAHIRILALCGGPIHAYLLCCPRCPSYAAHAGTQVATRNILSDVNVLAQPYTARILRW